MELWEKVILEWINCLKVQEETVKSITELQDGAFYINFLKLIKWKKLENFDHEDITRFIEEEYPTFKINKEDNAEHIYIASLLLLHMCRMLFKIHDSMQYNMCDKLKNETQIRVKAFLESILPIGNEITKETMREVIMEVEDTSTVADNFKTPPSENFFNSPVTRSARSQRIMTERIRELRDLRSNLAIERFTNTDLRDDITRQHNKIKKLEKKLEEKSAKIKELREERLKPITPKPSHTKEENSREDYYKRYINDLENQLTKQQDENNKLETEKDDISKELCCVRRTANHYKENFANCERSLESLSNTIELKDRELIELRMHNEELRAHIKELNGAANPEQSFEIEELSFSVAKSLNTSEPLSSVIDIQLQEAKEESAILHAQVDSLKGRFDLLTKDHRSLLESNRNLQEKVKMLNQVQAELNHVQKELDESNTIVASLQIEKNSLITQTEDMKSSLLFKEKKLSETELSNIKLNTELDGLKLDIKNLNEILENERINSLNLNAILEQTKLQMTEYLASIHKLTDERDSYNFSIENCCKNLRNILHCDNQFIQVKIDDLNNATLNDLTDYIDTMLHNCNAMHVSYKNDIGKLNTMIDETNTNLHKQQLTITSLEEQNKQNLVQLANIEEEKKRKDLLLNEQKEIIHTYSQEIEVLEKIRDEKFILEQNICELRNNLTNRDLLLKHVMTQLEDLRDIDKNFKLIKEEIQRNIDEYKKNIELTFKTLQQGYHTLHHNYYKVQQEKKELEYNFNCNKEELSKIQAINTTLQQNLFENKEKIDALEDLLHRERSDTITQMELKEAQINDLFFNISVLKTEKDDLIRSHKETLEAKEKELVMKEEALSTLQVKIEKLVNEANAMEKNTELKEAQINDLVSNVSALKTEKDDLMRSHKETLEAKNKELVMKEEALLTLQVKIEKLVNEANAMEKNTELKVAQINDLVSSISALKTEKDDLIRSHKETLEAKEKELVMKEGALSTLQVKIEKLVNEANVMEKNTELKEARINDLVSNVSALKTEKDELMRSHKETLEAKEKELVMKEEALSTLQVKIEILTNEANVMEKNTELKVAQINDLVSNVSALKTEKDDLMRSHKETLEAKEKELVMKEEALSTLQMKMEKLANEANVMEKKMKEVIINLQEVRSSQDAVLSTQEAALKEKCLYIEELQEQFDNSKKILNKELEAAKSSLRENQVKFFDLENQFNNQSRTIGELQDMLKTVKAELEASKEYCKQMDISQAEIVKLCQELEHPARNLNSTITDTCSDFDINDISQYECINIENKYKRINTDNNANILNIIKMTLDELYKSQKIISHLSCVNAELNKTLEKQEALIENGVKDKEEICGLKNKVRELEIIAQKRNNYLKSLIKNKESLKDSLQKVIATRNDLGTILISYKQKWNEILTKFQDIFHTDSSVCDEFKQLQIKKTDLENMLLKCQIDYSENIKSISDILWEKFLWTEQKLHDTYLCSIHEKECLDILTNVEDIFCNENVIIDNELEKFKALQTDLMKSDEEIESFTALATFYKNSLKSGQIKSQVEVEKNLQNQINQLTKERKDLKTKMDTMRLRNVKLEKNIDDLRTEIKKLKSITPVEANLVSERAEVQSLKEELERLKEQNQQLHKEKDESSKMEKQKLENQLKEIHVTYEQKLEDMKQQMKAAYNEQIMKLNKDQEKILQDKLQNQMEMMCQRQREELDRYKTHISGLSAQLWSVGEKLLSEQQQKQDALQCLKELQNRFKEFQADQPIATISRKTCRMEKQEMLPENAQQAHKVTTLITEETLERRQSIRSMQTIGNVFRTEDEEEIFDNVYLADMKKGNFKTITDVNRLSVLQMRNSLCKPHLKSSYPAEMQFLPPTLTEEEIKSGSPEDNFNDSLSQSLLPEQKAKKKDRSQISYKKPGPPTPSKNGGRLSLQGNELKSPNSRVLRERNVDRRTTTTPHSLKNIFSLKRQDENATSTPKRRLSSLFRKSRLQSDR